MSVADVRAKANELAAALETLDRQGGLGSVDQAVVQRLLRLAVKAYLACKRADFEREGKSPITPFGDDGTVTATEVAVICGDMLDAVDMDSFELNMWRALGQF